MIFRSISAIAIVLMLCLAGAGQTKNFTPVDGANLKAKIENAVINGKANAPAGRFWVGYQFEVRPGVGVDFEIVDSAGGVYISTDGASMMGLQEEVQRYESELIRQALQRTHGNQRRAAKLLRVKVTTLNCKIKRLGIQSGPPVDKVVSTP